jgi:hypothetical protein
VCLLDNQSFATRLLVDPSESNSFTIKLPEFSRVAMEFGAAALAFNGIGLPPSCTIFKRPSASIVRFPLPYAIGLSLLATHTLSLSVPAT